MVIDCVGPLPKTRAGHQYLLMCAATRYPEAIPLCKITSKAVMAAMAKYFSTCALPTVVKSDQGTNVLSSLFKQVLKSMSIRHQVSSPYHPKRQGALERWNQTLKLMLRNTAWTPRKTGMRAYLSFCLLSERPSKNPSAPARPNSFYGIP